MPTGGLAEEEVLTVSGWCCHTLRSGMQEEVQFGGKMMSSLREYIDCEVFVGYPGRDVWRALGY